MICSPGKHDFIKKVKKIRPSEVPKSLTKLCKEPPDTFTERKCKKCGAVINSYHNETLKRKINGL